jgi:integrase
MPRRPGVQITRDRRSDGSVTFGLRVRVSGADERVPLGNSSDGWDEARVERAREQLLAKIQLGLWSPRLAGAGGRYDEEPTVRELATDWLEERRRHPAIRPRTVETDQVRLSRYLLPFFGELLPSQITPAKVKEYRRRIHAENDHIRAAAAAGNPLRDPRTGHTLRPLGNESINKTLRTLALVLDEAEDEGWIERNVARGRRMRETVERRRTTGVLDVDEFLALLEAASELDNERHRPTTLERAAEVRALRDEQGLEWKAVAASLGIAPATAVYLYSANGGIPYGVRRAIIATLGLAGPRVTELCQLDVNDIDLIKSRIYIDNSKTEAGVRTVDIQPRLLDELARYFGHREAISPDAPALPTRTGTRRNKDNVRQRVIEPVVRRANELRAARGEPAIRARVTPHTFRRTYISFMLAAGFDLPYVQDQVGHLHPTTTLAVYAKVIRRPDRDRLRAEIRELLGVPEDAAPAPANGPNGEGEKAGNGRVGQP